jgi:hypothetical protein
VHEAVVRCEYPAVDGSEGRTLQSRADALDDVRSAAASHVPKKIVEALRTGPNRRLAGCWATGAQRRALPPLWWVGTTWCRLRRVWRRVRLVLGGIAVLP